MNKIPSGVIFMFMLFVYVFVVNIILVFATGFFTQLGLGLIHIVILSQSLMFFVPFVIYMLITKRKLLSVLPLRPLGAKNLFLIVAITLVILPMSAFLSAVTSLFTTNYVAEIMAHVATTYPFGLTLVAMALAPSFFEEIIFRGALYKEFSNYPIKKAAVLNGLFFGLIHMNFQQFFYAFAIGILFAYFVYYTGSILAPIISHFIINGLNIALIYAIPAEMLQEQLDLPYYYQPSPFIAIAVMGGISLAFVPLLLFLLRDLRAHTVSS